MPKIIEKGRPRSRSQLILARYPSLKRRRARCKPGTAAPLSNRHPNHQTPNLGTLCVRFAPLPSSQHYFTGSATAETTRHKTSGNSSNNLISTPSSRHRLHNFHGAHRHPIASVRAPSNPQTRCASWIEPQQLLPPPVDLCSRVKTPNHTHWQTIPSSKTPSSPN